MLGTYLLKHNNWLYFKRGTHETLYAYGKDKPGLWQQEPRQQIDRLVTEKLMTINNWTSRKMKDTTTFILSSLSAKDSSRTIDDVVDPEKVYFPNGVYSFSQDKLLPHSKDYYFSRGRDYPLTTKIQPTPLTDKWLLESVGDDGFKLLKKYIGYIFYRDNHTWQIFIILLAQGGDGKSTFFNWLNELVGTDNVSTVSLEAITNDKNRFALSSLVGKSLNYDADITNGLIRSSERLKKVTGNDRLDVEEKGKDSYKVLLFAKLMFAANDLPPFTDNSRGFKRRSIIIPFHRIPDFNNRYSLEAIYKEIPQFAYKCMREFWHSRKHELQPSPAMQKIQDDWIGANNHVLEFANDYCIVKEDERVKKVYLYQAYKSFCHDNGYKPLSSVQFRKELERLDYDPPIEDRQARIDGRNTKCYFNITLKPSEKIDIN